MSIRHGCNTVTILYSLDSTERAICFYLAITFDLGGELAYPSGTAGPGGVYGVSIGVDSGTMRLPYESMISGYFCAREDAWNATHPRN